jgi:hypothetical protein
MTANRGSFIIISSILLGAVPAFGSTGGYVLEKNVSPRAQAMGEAYIAMADDSYALYRNPAGLTYLRQSQFGGSYSTGLMDDSWGQISYVFAGNPCDTWGIGLLSYDGGGFQAVDYYGETADLRAQKDWLVTLAGAYRFTRAFRFGLALEFLHSTLLETYYASTAAVSMGMSFNLSPGLRLDAAINHFGFPMGYSYSDPWGSPFAINYNSNDALPVGVEMGMSYHLLGDSGASSEHDLAMAASGLITIDSMPRWHLGLEYWFLDLFAVRGGYKLNRDLETWSMGAGTRFDISPTSRAQLDYAYVINSEFNDVHKIEMTLLFKNNPDRPEGAQVLIVEPSDPYTLSLMKLGLGEGRLYGGAGASTEVMLGDYVGLFGGLGSYSPLYKDAGTGWATGFRTYIGPPSQGYRARISAFLSNGTRYTPRYFYTPGEVRQIVDYSISWGFQWRVREFVSLDLDAGFSVPVENEASESFDLNVGLSAHIPKGKAAGDYEPKEVKPVTGAHTDVFAARFLPSFAQGDTKAANTVPMGVVAEKVKLEKFVNGLYQVSGRILNESANALADVEMTLVYEGAAANTRTVAKLLPVDSNSPYECRRKPLAPGDKLDFWFRPDGIPTDVARFSAGITAVKESAAAPEAPVFRDPVALKLGFGFGWAYGWTGTNVELLLARCLGIYGAVGTMSLAGIDQAAWQTGLRFYFIPYGNPFRLRLGAGYGTAMTYSDKIYRYFPIVMDGFHANFGFQWRIAEKLSLDFDLAYVAPSDAFTIYVPNAINIGRPYGAADIGLTMHFDSLR